MWNNVTLRAYFDGGYVKTLVNLIFVYKDYLFYCCKKDKKIQEKISITLKKINWRARAWKAKEKSVSVSRSLQ